MKTKKQTNTKAYQSLINAGTSASTRRSYTRDVAYFWQWAKARFNRKPRYPVSSDMMIDFILDHTNGLPKKVEKTMIKSGLRRKGILKLNTIRRYISSVSVAQQEHGYPPILQCPKVNLLLRRARKANAANQNPNQKAAITKPILKGMLKTCDNTLTGIRDRAILLVGFSSGGRRRSELVDFEYKDVQKIKEGYMLTLRKSKTDQNGEGKAVPVLGQAAKALTKWLKKSGITSGKLFRGIKRNGELYDQFTGNAINCMIKRRLETAGYDSRQFGAHSLRAGFMTEAGKQGHHIKDAMQLSGHTDLDTALRYYRQSDIMLNPARNLI